MRIRARQRTNDQRVGTWTTASYRTLSSVNERLRFAGSLVLSSAGKLTPSAPNSAHTGARSCAPSPETVQSIFRAPTSHTLALDAPAVSSSVPALLRSIEAMRLRGQRVRELAVEGEPFWATPEIAVVPALVAATVECLAEPAA